MGLASWFLDLGVRAENTATQVGIRMGAVPLAWPVGNRGSIIYRLPRDPHQRASIFASAQTILVQDGEVAVVLEEGRAQGILEPGRYVFHRARVTGALDVIWVSAAPQAMKWGIGNVSSNDGIQLSANGVMYLRVDNALLFTHEVVQGGVSLSEIDLQRFLLPRIQGVLRSILARWPALELQTQRELFTDNIRQALTETVMRMGLGIDGFEVVEVTLPPEFKAVIQQATLAQHTGRADLSLAATRAQLVQIEATAAAQAQLSAGMAQVQIMAQLQAQGIDPLKLKALEALQTFAATPAQGAMLGADPRAALFGQLAAAALTPTAAPAYAAPTPLAALTHPTAPSTLPASAETPADVERQIDALVERLSEGKISEETYQKLVLRLEAKVARLQGV